MVTVLASNSEALQIYPSTHLGHAGRMLTLHSTLACMRPHIKIDESAGLAVITCPACWVTRSEDYHPRMQSTCVQIEIYNRIFYCSQSNQFSVGLP